MQQARLAVLALAIAACNGQDKTVSSPPKASPFTSSQGIPDVVLERVPVVVRKGTDNKCDWGSIDLTKVQSLINKHQKNAAPGTLIALENRNETSCTANLTVKVVESLKRMKEKAKSTTIHFTEPNVQAYEQSRAGCNSMIIDNVNTTVGSYRTAQAIIYSGSSPTQTAAFVDMTIYVKRANVAGNGGQNCVRFDSLTVAAGADEVFLFEANSYSISPFGTAPFSYSIMNQAPGGPSGASSMAYCSPGNCLASLYVGFYKKFFNGCGYSGGGEDRSFSVNGATTWPAYYYIHARTDGILQVAGWGYPKGFPATMTTCSQPANAGFPLYLEYNVVIA